MDGGSVILGEDASSFLSDEYGANTKNNQLICGFQKG